MFKNSNAAENQSFIETEMGVVTRKGEWFHTTAEDVEAFAPRLLQNVSFETLIKEAQAWVESTSSLALILLYVLLFVMNPWIAAGIALIFHWFWHHFKSAFVINKIAGFFIVINSDIFLFVVALISLSALGMQEKYSALIIGIVFFFLMKPGLLRKGWNRLSQTYTAHKLSLNDRLLKMIIIKHAMYEADSSPREVAAMEKRFVEIVTKIKNRDWV